MKKTFNNIPTIATSLVGLAALTLSTVSCSKPDSTVVQQDGNHSTSITAIHDTPESQQKMALANTETLKPAAVDALKANLKANLKTSGFETKIESVTATQMPDLYWVRAQGLPAFYTDKTGQFIVQGDVIKLGDAKPIDISTPLREADAKTALASVDHKDMIIFKAKGNTKAVVYAFTDVDCGYCRKLHNEIDDINALGIEVRYLAWPRAQQSVAPMENIWCSKDRQAAITAAKRGDKVAKAPKCDSPVKSQIDLGMQLGVRGTPAVFTESGKQIGGYLPAKELIKQATSGK